MPSLCECVEIQAVDDADIELVFDDIGMYRITIDITIGEYSHEEYLFFYGNPENARDYANSYLETIWGEEYNQTNYDDVDECYYDVNGEKAAQLDRVDLYNEIPAMSAKGAFHFQPTGWMIP
jgi:hypothetical protein